MQTTNSITFQYPVSQSVGGEGGGGGSGGEGVVVA